MPSVIVVEGPEGSGKTTTAKLLAQRMGFRYVHTGGAFELAEDWRKNLELEFVPMRGVVFDRFPSISEPIYSTIMSRPPRASALQLMDYWIGLGSEVELIYCRPDKQTMHENLLREQEKAHKPLHSQHLIRERHEALVFLYDSLMHGFWQPSKIYDYKKDTI